MILKTRLLFLALAAVYLVVFFLQTKLIHNANEKVIEDRNNEHSTIKKRKILSSSSSMSSSSSSSNKDPFFGKEKIMAMLVEMQVDPYSIDNATWSLVPTWSEVTRVWGDEPVISGLEQHCATFRQQISDPKVRRIAVAGLFSTGTNLLAQLLQHNCGIPERVEWLGRKKGHGMEWQVPWGKHNPFRYRGNHSVKDFLNDKRNPKLEDYLPAVTIRDPYSWMSSMCRHSYTAQWNHNKKNCPNFRDAKSGGVNGVRVRFGADKTGPVLYDSLAHMWNVWNGEYFYTGEEIPAVMVRFEDLIFYPKEVTEKVCECAGGKLMPPHHVFTDHEASGGGNFHYVVGTAITGGGHGGNNPNNGLLEAWIKYSKPKEQRIGKFSQPDQEFAKQELDSKMLTAFGYA